MPFHTSEAVVLVLTALAWVLVTSVLTVLAAQRRHALDIHDRVRESKRMRHEYLDAVRRRTEQ